MPLRVDEGDEDVLLMSLTGLMSQNSQEDVVVQGSGPSRGDKRRNAKLGVLRELVAVGNAILGIDLAAEKQVLVLADHDSRVLARKRVQAKAWDLGPVLDWACRVAYKHGFAGVTVGCEPTGHRWRVLNEPAAQRDCKFFAWPGWRHSAARTNWPGGAVMSAAVRVGARDRNELARVIGHSLAAPA